MTDALTFDSKLVEQIAEQKAALKMEEMKASLVSSLTGQKPPEDLPPTRWGEVARKEDLEKVLSTAEERIFQKIQADRQSENTKQLELQAQAHAKTQDENTRDWKNLSDQWKDAVSDGIVPDIQTPGLKEKLYAYQTNKGPSPTVEEMNDPGITAFAAARTLHDNLVKEGKTSSFTRTIEKYYTKQPAGASAPVLGNSVAGSNARTLTYKEVQENRRAKFGF